ncbi:hypothetical protein [Hankyongella ginsenosidimutans]|uniref:hypothetical protein n=1 Tax=Hankyongella ginsenosidimutans TaxID=1763828 RepID=UPI001CA35364|nr:hypothetical protein [Hankyongella ginsenosidimutans]
MARPRALRQVRQPERRRVRLRAQSQFVELSRTNAAATCSVARAAPARTGRSICAIS